MANANLTAAKTAKNDEFYTRLSDIENELWHYKEHFKGKVVYCNCDDGMNSNFFKFFCMHFDLYGMKKLIATGYNRNGGHSKVYTYYGCSKGDYNVRDEDIHISDLEGDGDFRSPECVEFLKESDIVVSNPPFSLLREFVAQLVQYGKKFLFIGNQNAITYKEIFPLIKDNKLWLGYNMVKKFVVPEVINKNCEVQEDGTIIAKFGNIGWFTNLTHNKRNEPLLLYKKYTPEEFPKYDNYDAINVNKVSDIPYDYKGRIGVPITFLNNYCPSQYRIVKFRKGDDDQDLRVNSKCPYFRILIQPL